MSDVLTQEEVDALLRDVSSGDLETGVGSKFDPEDVRDFDLTAKEWVSPNRAPAMDFVNELFARCFQSGIRKQLTDPVEVTAGETKLEKFADYLASQESPTSLNLLNVAALDGQILFVLSANLILNYVNLYFGGALGAADKLNRDFTATEAGVSRKLVDQACADLSTAWKDIAPIEFEHVSSESNPKFSKFFSPAETMALCRFEIHTAEESVGTFDILTPTSILEPLRKRLEASNQGTQQRKQAKWSIILEDKVKDSQVELHSILATTKVSLRELMRLRPGDILPLELPDTVELSAGVVTLFKGTFGISNGHNAIRISERIK